MGGGGKSQTTTQQVSIPPEVLARYNAVNARAEEVAKQPFKQYGTTAEAFVAPLTQAQQQGIAQTQQYAGAAQPYFGAATDQLLQAQQAGQAGTQAAYQPLMQGYQTGQELGLGAQQYFTGAGAAALPFYGAAAGGLGAGLEYAGGLQGAALQQAMGAQGMAAPLQQYGAGAITGAAGSAALPNVAAMRMGLGAARQAQPYYGAATAGTQAALQAGQPYGSLATQAALSGAQGISPQQFSQQAIGQYMSPFMGNVVQQTMAAQAQQNAQQRAALQGEAIRSGAFGGDRAGIAQANLAYQQNLANQKVLADLLQGGYGQALGAFQQQQGVNLAAEQANRAAQQQLAQQALAIGQQGYGQQLGAAQQMAGLGQALFGQGMQGAQTLSGLGQTQFGQQLGAGQAAAQLGQQLYGQGMTGAQFLQGLGGQGFQQQLAAAQQQQQLGQGLAGLGFQTGQALQGLGAQQAQLGQSTAAQQAALAQQGYGMGAGTAQALAGLGQGAQAAGLQGAQAMLGAGQIAQQTEQAGKQALYNQFLQQQGYPFQVAQFLANIAMGTGALSGSTTTTTQPAPFFSDRKLKEDVRKVGETEEGLPIYKFRYKGEDKDQTHIGYMADEVEKKHPDAVGEYGGAKYVDYAKVNARESMGGAVHGGGLGRAAYAYGGADHIDANDLQALIRQQQQMYGPSLGGLYGTSAQQTPLGGKANVPTGGLHVGKLATAGALPRQQQSGLDQSMGAAQKAKETAEMIFGKYNPQTKQREGGIKDQLKGASDTVQGFFKSDDKAAEAARAAEEARKAAEKGAEGAAGAYLATGGLVPRAGYKFGGEDMYKAQQSYVPEDVLENDEKQPDLMTAKGGSGGGGGGGKSGLGTALGAAGTLASFIPGVGPAIGAGMKLASAFFADGGVVPRHGYEDGGEAKKYGLDDYLNALAQIESSGNYGALGPVTKSGDRAYGKYQVMGRNVPEWTEQHLGRRMTPDEFLKDEKAQEAVARGQFGGYLEKYGRPEDAASMWFSGRPMAEAGQRADITGTTVPAYIQRFQKALGMPVSEGGLEGGRAQVASTQAAAPTESTTSKLGDLLTSSRFWAPVGTGLLTMASSPSRYLGAAALQGLGAGLAAMQPAEEREAKIQEIKTDIAGKQQAQVQNSLKVLPDGTKIIWLKGGKFMYADEYDDLRAKGQAPELLGYVPTNAEQLAQSPDARYTPQSGAGGVGPSPTAPMKAPPGGVELSPEALQAARDERAIIMRGGPQATTNKAISDLWLAQTTQQGTNARASIKGVGDIAQNIADNAQNEGFASMGFGASLRAQYMNFANTVLRSVGQPPINNLDSAVQIQNKLAIVQAEMAAAGADQRSFAAMDQILGAQPNMDMNPESATKLSADLWVARQRQIDRDNFRIAYGKPSYNSFAQADAYFNENYSMERYQREQAAIHQLLKTDPQLLKDLRSGKLTPAQIDKGFEKTFGQPFPGISRYFVSGRR